MVKVRLIVTAITFLILIVFGSMAILFARGYRLGIKEKGVTISPQGLLSITSDPSGAEVYINGKLKTATDNTISLPPGEYEVSIKKEGFLEWKKRLVIEKEVVTPTHAFLIHSAPSLTALTFSGSINPKVSADFSKIAFIIPPVTENGVELTTEGSTKAGLWIIEMTNLPLGFSRDPRQITDGDLSDAEFSWSPDGREILLTLNNKNYLLKTSEFTPQNQRLNISANLEEIKKNWEAKEQKILLSRLSNLPTELEEIFSSSAENIRFSPDGDKILYTAKENSFLPENLVKTLPGSSTQPQERNIKKGTTYVYDIKEDRNFKLAEKEKNIYWLPNSHNLLIPQEQKIVISDYDGTNKQDAFTGGYIYPYAYPSNSLNKIIILTSLGAQSTPNLYWLSLK